MNNEEIELREIWNSKYIEIAKKIVLPNNDEEKSRIKKLDYIGKHIQSDLHSAQLNFTIIFYTNPIDHSKAEIWWGGGADNLDSQLMCYYSNNEELIMDYAKRFEQLLGSSSKFQLG